MNKLPALIRSFNKPNSKYHITDDGKKTRCGRRIESLVETHPLLLDENERCPKCGPSSDFEVINNLREKERKEEDEARKAIFKKIDETHKAQCDLRPGLIREVELLINGINIEALNMALGGETGPELEIQKRHFENCDNLRVPVDYKGQHFTIKIEVWNGDHS